MRKKEDLIPGVFAFRGQKGGPVRKGTKIDVDPEVVKARGRFGAALQHGDPDAAAQAARELVRARIRSKERVRIEEAKAVLIAAGYTVTDGAA